MMGGAAATVPRFVAVAARMLVSAAAAASRMALAVGKGSSARRSILGAELVALFQGLGPTFVKCGQLLSTRRDLLPSEVIERLGSLREATKPIRFEDICRNRTDEFGFDVADAFAHVEPEPLASGSVACVYRGVTPDGRRVAIKIRRPGVGRIIAADVACLRVVAGALSVLTRRSGAPFAAVADAVGDAMLQQLDFEREAEMMRRLKDALAIEASVAVPAPFETLCGPAVITMELLDAFCRAELRDADGSLAEASRAGLRALYRMIFVEGLIHCDLHDGNIRLLPNGCVEIVDFGLVSDLEHVDRLLFAEFFYSVATCDGDRSAAITLDTAMSVPKALSRDGFIADIRRLVESVGATPATFSVAGFVIRLFEIQRRHGVLGSPKFATAILSLLAYEGAVRRWSPDLDFRQEAQRYIFLGSFRREQDEPMAATA